MPIYVYICTACKEKVEEIQKMDDPPPAKCPECGKKGSLQKTVSVSNFQLIGSGWSSDGYA